MEKEKEANIPILFEASCINGVGQRGFLHELYSISV
jgi:hypothetical protein